jgi:hypothetical protein
MDHRAAPQIKQVLPAASIAGAPSLPVPNMGQPMFDSDPLAQLGASQRRQLALTQFPEQSLIRVDRHTTPAEACGTPFSQWAGRTGCCRKVDDPTRLKRQFYLVGTPHLLALPVQVKGGLGKPSSRRAWPNRLYVSSTRLAPHNGLLSRAARN